MPPSFDFEAEESDDEFFELELLPSRVCVSIHLCKVVYNIRRSIAVIDCIILLKKI